MMKTSKINIGLAPTKNYDKVTLEMIDEPIEYDSDEEFKAAIKHKFKLIRELVDEEFRGIQK